MRRGPHGIRDACSFIIYITSIYIYIDSPSFLSNPDIIIYISIVHIVVYIFSICICRFACDSSKDSIYAIQITEQHASKRQHSGGGRFACDCSNVSIQAASLDKFRHKTRSGRRFSVRVRKWENCGSPWFARGSPVVRPWFARGSPWFARGSPWFARGSPVVRRGSPGPGLGLKGKPNVVRPWFARGSPVVRPWFARGSRVVRPWFARGSPVVRPWFARGSPVVRPWARP